MRIRDANKAQHTVSLLGDRDGGTGASGRRHHVVVVVSAASRSALVQWGRISGAWGEKRGGLDPRAATGKTCKTAT